MQAHAQQTEINQMIIAYDPFSWSKLNELLNITHSKVIMTSDLLNKSQKVSNFSCDYKFFKTFLTVLSIAVFLKNCNFNPVKHTLCPTNIGHPWSRRSENVANDRWSHGALVEMFSILSRLDVDWCASEVTTARRFINITIIIIQDFFPVQTIFINSLSVFLSLLLFMTELFNNGYH